MIRPPHQLVVFLIVGLSLSSFASGQKLKKDPGTKVGDVPTVDFCDLSEKNASTSNVEGLKKTGTATASQFIGRNFPCPKVVLDKTCCIRGVDLRSIGRDYDLINLFSIQCSIITELTELTELSRSKRFSAQCQLALAVGLVAGNGDKLT